jgi:hypothetical protein
MWESIYKQEFPSSRSRESGSPEEEDALDYLESLLNNIALVTANRIPDPNARRDQL